MQVCYRNQDRIKGLLKIIKVGEEREVQSHCTSINLLDKDSILLWSVCINVYSYPLNQKSFRTQFSLLYYRNGRSAIVVVIIPPTIKMTQYVNLTLRMQLSDGFTHLLIIESKSL